MTKRLFCTLLLSLALTGVAVAQSFPSYYPKDGFQRTGQIDAYYPEEGRIVINDRPYQLADSVIVHSMSAYSDSKARLKQGQKVGYKIAGGRLISAIWLLPAGYDDRRRR